MAYTPGYADTVIKLVCRFGYDVNYPGGTSGFTIFLVKFVLISRWVSLNFLADVIISFKSTVFILQQSFC